MSDQKQPNITIDRGAALKDVDISTHNNNNTVIYQGGAAEDKRKEENRAFFKDFACRLIEKGIITDDIRRILDSKAFELNLSDIERDHIIEQVRSYTSKNTKMSELHRIALSEARADIQENRNIDGAIISLKALADTFSDEEVDFFYNMAMAAKKPGEHINQYINRKTDSYWQTYWAYTSYVKMKRYEEAEKLILKLGDYADYPIANVIPILKNTGFLIKTSDHKALKAMIKDISGERISPEISILNSTLEYVANNGVTLSSASYANFYLENFFNLKNGTAKVVLMPKDEPVKKADTNYGSTGNGGNGTNGNNGNTRIATGVNEAIRGKIVDDVIKVTGNQGGNTTGNNTGGQRVGNTGSSNTGNNGGYGNYNGGNTGRSNSNGPGSILKYILIGAACVIVGAFVVNKLGTSEEKAATEQTSTAGNTNTGEKSSTSGKTAGGGNTTSGGKTAGGGNTSAGGKTASGGNTSAGGKTTAGGKTAGNGGDNPPPTPPPPKPSEMTANEAHKMGQKLLAEGKYATAASYLSSAADRGSIAATYDMAVLYKNGSGVSKNTTTAFEYMLKAAEAGYTKAFRELGEMYHGGRGTLKDRSMAEYWYRKAAAAGDTKAERLLNNM